MPSAGPSGSVQDAHLVSGLETCDYCCYCYNYREVFGCRVGKADAPSENPCIPVLQWIDKQSQSPIMCRMSACSEGQVIWALGRYIMVHVHW